MDYLKNYISGFLNRSGGYIFFATIFSRVLSFLTSWITLQLIPNKELGEVLYSWNIISFLMPLIGLGLHQSYIRYGALPENSSNGDFLFSYIIKKGLIASFILTLITAICGFIIPFEFNNSGIYISIMSLVFAPSFLIEALKTKARLAHKNKSYAFIDISYNFSLILIVVSLSYFLQEIGYILALIITPTLLLLFYLNTFFTGNTNTRPHFINREFWKYGFFAGLSNVATLLLFSIDILLIGNIMELPEKVTAFRYITLIPYSILFLPRVFIATDFVSLTENIRDKDYVFSYIKSYILLFTIVSLLFIFIVISLGESLLNFFHSSFTIYTDSFTIVSIGIIGILILRGLFGNLLSSIGKAKFNYYIMVIAIILNIASNYLLIPILGIKGAAITSATLLWFTGIASCIGFFHFYKKYTSL
ncbi:Membrane protein involved in the export of O-antigen and teichoic acid [Tenacibaculum sp. MAR_2009_124]|uniref:polysaccharide biosynthesis C-terminal domain-containing protein n=1 Tax=Tenacibaculum sp. MAR_2009_124 TaxID=1250059 RepID=UPI00089B8EBB|nr:polysaccharide biosynthesis C-terminal domain-containing protein [Tenacibaculum sp. MAR_2009_124]SEC85423.1 Membrane protein involved in the export of O-antigen and teichoic acid [Tenacibaculum sp. MAR_2009_124]